MNTNINDGGPAYPCSNNADVDYNYCNSGMTLRDWFAGQALAGLITSEYYSTMAIDADGWNSIAQMSYANADAMLKARAAK